MSTPAKAATPSATSTSLIPLPSLPLTSSDTPSTDTPASPSDTNSLTTGTPTTATKQRNQAFHGRIVGTKNWSVEESLQLLQCVSEYYPDWQQVSTHTSDAIHRFVDHEQCKSRWRKLLASAKRPQPKKQMKKAEMNTLVTKALAVQAQLVGSGGEGMLEDMDDDVEAAAEAANNAIDDELMQVHNLASSSSSTLPLMSATSTSANQRANLKRPFTTTTSSAAPRFTLHSRATQPFGNGLQSSINQSMSDKEMRQSFRLYMTEVRHHWQEEQNHRTAMLHTMQQISISLQQIVGKLDRPHT